MTQYGGVDLLLIPPNAVTSWGTERARAVDRVANANGNVVTATRDDARTTDFTLTWNVATRADLATLRAFLDARFGQLVPCWVPTYQRDLDMVGLVAFVGAIVTATPISALLADEPHLRYWIGRAPGGSLYRTKYWNQYSDPADGTHVWNATGGPTEIGDAPIFGLSSASGYVWSRLMYCRMASDRYHVAIKGQASVVTADFREVASELTG